MKHTMADEMPGAERGALSIIASATFLALVVFTAPLTTLDSMTDALRLTPDAQAWIMSGMPLGAACGLLTAGAIGDTLGRKRTFVGGLWLTVVSSVAAALAPDGTFLIAMRVIQGFGSAGIMACGLGLLGQIFHGESRRHAAAIWAASLGGGVAAGPIIASLLLSAGGWQGIHWLIALVSAGLAVAAAARLPESPRSGEKVDIAGSVLLMTGLGCLLAALTEARVGEAAMVATLCVAGVVLVLLFVVVETRVKNPILTLDLFRDMNFTGATLAAFASGAGVLALMSMVPTVLVRGLGKGPLFAAIVLVTWSGLTVVAALCARFLPHRFSSRQRVIWSILGCAFAQFLLIFADDGWTWAAVLPGLVLAGISNGILNASLGHEAVQTVPLERTAMGSAANNTARYLGSAIGIAMVSLLISEPTVEGLFAGWHVAVLASTAISLFGVGAMLFVARRGAEGPS
ncbi:MFS transporter [Roseibium suaedae]|nr:MFS transporter [Roseibium suaedae]